MLLSTGDGSGGCDLPLKYSMRGTSSPKIQRKKKNKDENKEKERKIKESSKLSIGNIKWVKIDEVSRG